MAQELVTPYTDDRANTYEKPVLKILERNVHDGRKGAHIVLAYFRNVDEATKCSPILGADTFDIQEQEQAESDSEGKPTGLIIPAFDSLFGLAVFEEKQTNPKAVLYKWITSIEKYQGKEV